ncbi:MAG: endopeptidase La [Oscillospiraceae bacterium]|jgi:ATP-dependent Lon protease|nr:endopeptidase La [Oscillospiraceae bacterium]
MANTETTQNLPLLALRGLTVFPRMLIHIDVGRDKSVHALDEALSSGQPIFLAAQRDLREDDPGPDGLYEVGTISRVCQILRLPGHNMRVLVEGVARARMSGLVREDPAPIAQVTPLHIPTRRTARQRVEAALRLSLELFERYAELVPRLASDALLGAAEADEPGFLADYITQNMSVRHEDKQAILETLPPLERLSQVTTLLMREIELLEIEQDIQGKLHQQLGKNQKEYYLREQLKTIQSELGDREDTVADLEDYREKIFMLRLGDDTEGKLLQELGRLSRMSPASPEAAVVRTWLDTVLGMPWTRTTNDRLDIEAAQRLLDKEHYGLTKVKERILEFLAVKSLAPNLKSQVLCLVGPPGVGKTSVAQSLARAMGRKTARLSLGGVRDEADVRGHRKTYIGAMPGRIMTAMRQAGARNPVLVLDEVDKMGHDFRGDPAAALLEVFDPEQNHAFHDHYLELPFDLSEVVFITTANTTEPIPPALLDRMELIELTSYTDEEKLRIAKDHLLPKQLALHGLKKTQLRLGDDALRELIAGYTRESGVRRLERELAALCRKTARQIVAGERERLSLKAGGLEALLGPRKYKPERARAKAEVGVASGLAWTRVGGELLEVEADAVEGTGKIDLTGNLGEVMKESARAALTYIRGRCHTLGIDPAFYKNRDIHIHFPEGAVPKDGPSAGITVAVAMVSALTGAPVRRDVAMTGEITLRGRVLPIGGLKEKTMAAFRAGAHTVIIPRENEKDLADIDPSVRDALQFITVEHMDAVLAAALDMPLRPAKPGKRKGPAKPAAPLPVENGGWHPEDQPPGAGVPS